MSSAAQPPAAPRPSVFISYASEDRPAARALRDLLVAAGIDAWCDENELGGGDAWDQKIRRQIRDCDYFMPVISATTERRKEGYFRREWRLAAERTLDMADDVLFLLPVAIDDTSETGARVPEKFFTVQWLRAPGGQPTPALEALAQRLLAGGHPPPPSTTRPPLPTRPPQTGSFTVPPMVAPPLSSPPQPPPTPPAAHGAAPPPMPAFPHAPEKGGVGHWLKFAAEIVWWIITAAWLLFARLPRWLRIVVAMWVVITLVSTCGDLSSKSRGRKSPEPVVAPSAEELERVAAATAEQIAAAFEKNAQARDWSKIAEEIGRRVSGERGPERGAKALLLVPLAPDSEDPRATQFAQQVFSRCYGQLVLARRHDAALSPVLPAGSGDDSLAALGRQQRARLVFATHLEKNDDGTRRLRVRVIRSEDGGVAWSAEFPVQGSDPKQVSANISAAILPLLPPRK